MIAYRTCAGTIAVTDSKGPWPVVWQNDVIGSASTRVGALRVAKKVPISRFERRSASLVERLDGSLAWACGAVLAQRKKKS